MSDVKQATIYRILSALVALPLYTFTIVTEAAWRLPLLGCSLIVTLASLWEFYRITDKGEQGRAFMVPGMIGAVAVNALMYWYAFGATLGTACTLPAFDARLVMGLVAVAVALVLVLQMFTRPLAGAAYSTGVTVLGLVFIVLFFSHIMLMKTLPNGVFYILLLNIVVMINDSAAYFGGVFLGKHKTGFAVSPNKSWEGYAFGLVFSIVAMIVTVEIHTALYGTRLFHPIESVIVGALLSVFGNFGDLAESAFKRDGSIKDSGSIIPGHGGMWDVFDALIFTMPLFYYYLVLRGASLV